MSFNANKLAKTPAQITTMPKGIGAVKPTICHYSNLWWTAIVNDDGYFNQIITVNSSTDGTKFNPSKTFTAENGSSIEPFLTTCGNKLWLFYPRAIRNGINTGNVVWMFSTYNGTKWSDSEELNAISDGSHVLTGALNATPHKPEGSNEEKLYISWTVEGIPGSYTSYLMIHSDNEGWSQAYPIHLKGKSSITGPNTPSLMSFDGDLFLAGSTTNNKILVSYLSTVSETKGAVFSRPALLTKPSSIGGIENLFLLSVSGAETGDGLYCFFQNYDPLAKLQALYSEDGMNDWNTNGQQISHLLQLPQPGFSMCINNKTSATVFYAEPGIMETVNVILYDF